MLASQATNQGCLVVLAWFTLLEARPHFSGSILPSARNSIYPCLSKSPFFSWDELNNATHHPREIVAGQRLLPRISCPCVWTSNVLVSGFPTDHSSSQQAHPSKYLRVLRVPFTSPYRTCPMCHFSSTCAGQHRTSLEHPSRIATLVLKSSLFGFCGRPVRLPLRLKSIHFTDQAITIEHEAQYVLEHPFRARDESPDKI